MKRIVVGIDGSAESKQALRWAAAEAKLRGAVLRVVHTWFFPYIAAGPGLDPVLDARSDRKCAPDCRATGR